MLNTEGKWNLYCEFPEGCWVVLKIYPGIEALSEVCEQIRNSSNIIQNLKFYQYKGPIDIFQTDYYVGPIKIDYSEVIS